MLRHRKVVALFFAGSLVWFGYLAYRAHLNLVTLDVRQMDVRQVASKIEWQTWERVLVNKQVKGAVTLKVKNAPLDEVLNIIGLQTGSRWTALYPIYGTRKSVGAFKRVVLGELEPQGSGWTNYLKTPLWQRGGSGGMFGNTARAGNSLVSAQFLNKDLTFATFALSRFTQAHVVSEDSAKGTINLKLEEVPFRKAVSKVAKQVRRGWDRFYALQPMHHAVAVRPGAEQGQPKQVMVTRDPNPVAREQETEAFLATMTPEERRRTQEQMAAAQSMQSLPASERQQMAQDMRAQASQSSQEDLQQRIQNRLKNGTPEQRVAKDRGKLNKPPREQN